MSEQATTPTAADLQQALRAARQQAVEVTKAHTVATRAQLVLEQAVEAEAFLSSHAARVAALETRAEALGASIVSLETREAVAQKRLETVAAEAQAEVERVEGEKNRALEALAADWAEARRRYDEGLVTLGQERMVKVAEAVQEAEDLEARVARARQDLAALKAAL